MGLDMLSRLLLIFISVGNAQEGDFTLLSEGQQAPFEGVLLSPEASAQVLSSYDEQQARCALELEYQLDVAGTEFKLREELLQVRLDTLQEQHSFLIQQKDEEIEGLHTIIEKQSPQYKWFWFVGGAALGGAVYYGIDQALQ